MPTAVTPLQRLPRARPRPVPLGLRLLFRVLGEVSPWLAARLALARFKRLDDFPMARAEGRLAAEATRGWVHTPSGGIRTYRWSRGPFLPWENRLKRGRVLLVHGWGGRATQWAAFIEPLRAEGFELWAFDATLEPYSETLREAITAMDAAHGPFYAALGHGLGGSAVVAAMAAGLSAPRVVTLGAPAQSASMVGHVLQRLGLLESAARSGPVRRRVDAALPQASDVSDRGQDSSERHHRCALVMHDVDDASVPFSEAQRLNASWRQGTLVATAGLGHRLILRDPMVVAEVGRFLTALNPYPFTCTRDPFAAPDA